jgi:hypothetical protein
MHARALDTPFVVLTAGDMGGKTDSQSSQYFHKLQCMERRRCVAQGINQIGASVSLRRKCKLTKLLFPPFRRLHLSFIVYVHMSVCPYLLFTFRACL